MKILFVVIHYTYDYATFGTYITNQAVALHRAGHTIGVLHIDMRSPFKRRRLGFYKEQRDGFPVWRLSIPFGPLFPAMRVFIGKKAALLAMKPIVREFGTPDILHSHFFQAAVYGAYIKKKYNIPHVTTEHSSRLLEATGDNKEKRNAEKLYKNSDKMIAVSSALARDINHYAKVACSVIPNIVPDIFCTSMLQQSDIFRFISIGNIKKDKRFDLVILAFARLASEQSNIELNIYGKGEESDALKMLAAQKNILNKVNFNGVINNAELPDLYRGSDCFVLASDYETFGVVYAEAVMCGLPIIATQCGGPEDIVNKNNGLLVPVNDEKALYEAMKYMYHNSKIYKSETISSDAQSCFGESAVAQKIIKVYNEMLQNEIIQ